MKSIFRYVTRVYRVCGQVRLYLVCSDTATSYNLDILATTSLAIVLYGEQTTKFEGAQWLSGRVLDSRLKGHGFQPHRRHCVVSLSKNINPSLVLVQPRKTRPFITERLLMGRKESNQTYKQTTKFARASLVDH